MLELEYNIAGTVGTQESSCINICKTNVIRVYAQANKINVYFTKQAVSRRGIIEVHTLSSPCTVSIIMKAFTTAFRTIMKALSELKRIIIINNIIQEIKLTIRHAFR